MCELKTIESQSTYSLTLMLIILKCEIIRTPNESPHRSGGYKVFLKTNEVKYSGLWVALKWVTIKSGLTHY